MPVDPQVTPLLEAMAGMAQIDWWSMDPAVMRQGFGTVGPEPEKIEVAKVVDRTIPGPAGEIPVRIYTPEGTGPFPLVAFFHGGGFVLCGLDSHDTLARALCRGAGAIVVSVDYRLAPESKFPAAADDCYAATKWVADHAAELGGDAERLAVAGDSAGGNLSAVTALLAKRKGGPRLVHQLLVYPVTSHEPDTDSYRENAEGYFLTADMMKWFTHHYLRDAKDAKDPLAAPIHATKADLAGLPPAIGHLTERHGKRFRPEELYTLPPERADDTLGVARVSHADRPRAAPWRALRRPARRRWRPSTAAAAG